LHLLAGIEEINQLRVRIAGAYLAHIAAKVEAIAIFAANQGASLLVFPEYSISSGALEACQRLSDDLKLVIVAGSHVATLNSLPDYERIGLKVGEEILNRAVCPVIVPDCVPVLYEKLTRSKWESALLPGEPPPEVELRLNGIAVTLQVAICIDAIQAREARRGVKHTSAELYAIPSLTPRVDLFYDKGRLLLAGELPSLFVNAAEYGGSRAFARTERLSRWYTEEDGTKPIPRFSEALVVIELDIASQFEIRKSTAEHAPTRDAAVYPLLYPEMSADARDYIETLEKLQADPAKPIAEIRAEIGRFTILDERLFPILLQDKLRHLMEVAALGVIPDGGWGQSLGPVLIRATAPTDTLRWELCGESIQLINDLLVSGRYPEKFDLLTSVYKYLLNRRRELGTRVTSSVTAKPKGTSIREETSAIGGIVSAFEPPFYNRESSLDGVRRFVESAASNCLVVAGMRGIGKTSMTKEVFKKVLPPTWKSAWVQLNEGTSYPRFLAEVAYRCGIRTPPDLTDSPAGLFAASQDALLYLSQTPRVVLVVDDLQFALEPNGEFADPNLGKFLSEAITKCARSRNKIVLITTVIPRISDAPPGSRETTRLKGLEKKHAETLLSFWFHFEREDLRGQPIDLPESLFNVLDGHPLGLRIAAKMWAENPLGEADLSIFKRLRETVVGYILDRVNLSPREEEFIRFASVFRQAVSRDVFLRWKKDEASFLLDSFIGRSFLESEGDKFNLHPLIREHFYDSAPTAALQPYHKIAAEYFLDTYSGIKATGLDADPELLGEAIYHLLSAGERAKAKSLGLYKYDIRPVALNHYRKAEYGAALKDYLLVTQLDPNDLDAHFHLALIYARDGRWDDAELHFGTAITLNSRAYWVYQGYAHQKLNAGRVAEAEHLLDLSQEIKQNHSPTLVDLARINDKRGQAGDAEDYFRLAIEADENNGFAYFAYARFLMNQQRYEEGLKYALGAAEINPRDFKNRELVKDLRQRIERAKNPG
jgi:tetratricopeptide (TPR) repeat protein